jgi:hypothetical protein
LPDEAHRTPFARTNHKNGTTALSGIDHCNPEIEDKLPRMPDFRLPSSQVTEPLQIQ